MFRLALALGRTVGELLDGISYRELQQWGDYYALEPWGEWRGDVRTAHICSVLANTQRDEKRRPQPYVVSDFMLSFGKVSEAEAVEGAEVEAKIDASLIAWLFSKSRETEAGAKAH